ncbi:hypothetical protein ONZ45_g4426 [Pleurotus djamor]|nr:hypothetical protein ONZ45_g4426 [Pleurotus djamor]
MYTYVGKLNWGRYAVDDTLIMVFPKGLDFKDPVQTYHQWTVTADGKPKATDIRDGHINTVSDANGVHEIQFFLDPEHFYRFKATVSEDKKELDVTMWKDSGITTSMNMELHYSA